MLKHRIVEGVNKIDGSVTWHVQYRLFFIWIFYGYWGCPPIDFRNYFAAKSFVDKEIKLNGPKKYVVKEEC